MTAPTFTKDELERIESSPDFTLPMRHLAAFAFALMERIEMLEAERDVANGTACAEEQADGKGPCGVCRNCSRAERDEARATMASWGCPNERRICLNCGRETPCMTEADLKSGDPGTPCTFDMTYPEMIEHLHRVDDQRDEARRELAGAEGALNWLMEYLKLADPSRCEIHCDAVLRARERERKT